MISKLFSQKKLLMHDFRNFSILFFLILFSLNSLAQSTLQGKVQYKQIKKPAAYATVVVTNEANVSQSTKTDKSGQFEFLNLPHGQYTLKCISIGYQTYETKFTFSQNMSLPIIELSTKSQQLQNVTISAQKTKTNEIATKIFTPNQFVNVQNANAQELLNNLPSINVSSDNSGLSFRGDESVTILINGKQSNMTVENLAQIPANSIEKIEVLSVPGAKNISEGSAGIINIVLKSNKSVEESYGFLSLGIGTGNKYYIQSGYSFPVGDKLNIGLNYNFKYEEFDKYTNSSRTYLANSQNNNLRFREDEKEISAAHFIRTTMNYRLSEHDVFQFVGSFGFSPINNYARSAYQIFSSNQALIDTWSRIPRINNENINFEFIGSYTHNFTKENSLSLGIAHNTNNNQVETSILQDEILRNNTLVNWSNIFLLPKYQRRTNTLLNLDLKHHIDKTQFIETGLLYSLRDFRFRTDFYNDTLPLGQRNFWAELNPNLSNDFNFEEQVSAIYLQHSKSWSEKSKTVLGLRLEQTNTTSFNYDTILRAFNYFNFFPSFSYQYDFSAKSKISTSYAYRINRPSPGMLNPLQDVEDLQSARFGNPNLLAELIHSLEVNYNHDFNSSFRLSSGVFYKYSDNAITRYVTYDELGRIQINIENLGRFHKYGLDFTLGGKVNKFLNYNFNFLLTQNQLNFQTAQRSFQRDFLTYNPKLVLSAKLPWDIYFQNILIYNSAFNTPQGQIQSVFTWDIALRKSFWNNKAQLSLSISDILDQKRFHLIIQDNPFNAEVTRKPETRIGILSFKYNFGSIHKSKENDGQIKASQDSGGL
ncbi:MAG: TonB-dependent receptor [Chitinophagales bacterium]|jgi:outer membrane receptor protein involved in Fe transport|nr:TonB-dependent receptor [Chitinophagales bacterium]